ncbi:MAG TPA: DUF6527 family protein [Methylotenera sp.]
MPKIFKEETRPEGYQALNFYCPGCKRVHGVNYDPNHQWSFNGDIEKPTLSPSVLCRYPHPKGYTNDNPAPTDFNGEYVTDICHSFVTDGRIQFLGDSTHELAGQTVDLPEFKWSDEDESN